MTDTTTTLRCERGNRSRCLRPAFYATPSTWWENGQTVPGWEGVCKVHGASMKRWGASLSVLAESGTISEAMYRHAEQRAAAEREARAEKQARNAEREEKYTADAWAAYPNPWTSTLVIQTRQRPTFGDEGVTFYDENTIEVRIHPEERDPSGWDSITVALYDDPKRPAYVQVRGGSPATLTPNAARLVAEAIALVSAWVEEVNA